MGGKEATSRASEILADQPNGQAFKFEICGVWPDQNGFKVGVLRQQGNPLGVALKAFDGDLIAQACDHDLAVARFTDLGHGQQIAIQDAGITHAHAFDAQQVIGFAGKQRGFDRVTLFDVFLCQDGMAGRDSAHQGQHELLQPRQGQAARQAAQV